MKIKYHKNFVKNYSQRISPNKNLDRTFKERCSIFVDDLLNPILKNHRLLGAKRHLYAFAITGDIRVVYQKLDSNTVIFVDIGTHNQVY